MNEKQSEKRIVQLIQDIRNHVSSTRDGIASTQNALDHVARREAEKPSAELKGDKQPDPIDITSALEQLSLFCAMVAKESDFLSERTNYLF